MCRSFSPLCLHLPNRVIESIFFLLCVLPSEGAVASGDAQQRKPEAEEGNFSDRSWEQIFSLGQLLFISVRRPFSTLSLSVLSFLESSSSMGTGISIIRQAFRHLLEGDEKNMRRGRAEERQQGRVQGTGFDWGGHLAMWE